MDGPEGFLANFVHAKVALVVPEAERDAEIIRSPPACACVAPLATEVMDRGLVATVGDAARLGGYMAQMRLIRYPALATLAGAAAGLR